MKFWLLIIFLTYATFWSKNAESVSQGEQEQETKLNKSFDEIFGKGWDAEVPEFTETKEWHKKETTTTEIENKSTDQPNPNEQNFSDHFESFANRKIRERFDEMFDENWSEDDNEFIEEAEADSTDQNDCIDGQKCQKVQENGSQGTIQKWKKEFSLSIDKKFHSKQEKMEKLKQYCEIKKSNPKISDFEIAESLNIGANTLKQWKRELKNSVKNENDFSLQKELDQIAQDKFYSDQQKREILKQFDEIKSKCKKAKLKNSSKHELDDKIAKKIGVSTSTINEWKRKFGLSVSNKISDATKIGILKKYAKIKRNNPKMRDLDIVDLLKISISSLTKWKAKFKEEIKNF